MKQQISTKQLNNSTLKLELTHLVEYFTAHNHKDCRALFGWEWGVTYYSSPDWTEETIALNQLMDKIQSVSQSTQSEFGNNDLFIKIADVEFHFCHESDIHLAFNQNSDVVAHFYARWRKQDILHTTNAYIALGANLGNPLQQLDKAALTLSIHPSITRLAMSPVYQSIPHGNIKQPDFMNAVLAIRTTLSAQELLNVMHAIEDEHGRERQQRWGARTLDLDLILYGDAVIQHDHLSVPHPLAHKREFVIKPLYDLDKTLTIPNYGRVADLIETLPLDNLTEVRCGTTYHH